MHILYAILIFALTTGFYVDLDGSGNVKGIYAKQQFNGQTQLADDHAKITAYLNPVVPNVPGFKVALIGIYAGDFLAINTLYAAYPLFKDMLDSQTWPVVTLILIDARSKAVISQGIYDGIKAALPTYHIPVELP